MKHTARLLILTAFSLALPACGTTGEQWLNAGTQVASAAASGAAAGFTSGLAQNQSRNVGPFTATK